MSQLFLHNSLTQEKQLFTPIVEGKVRMYVCGVTVYDYCHLGHARAYVVFDLLRRVLTHLGYDVTHIQNFTDIDDKIIKRSGELGEDCSALTDRFITAYFEDMDALSIQRATRYPKATDYMPHVHQLIQTLIDANAAYVVEGTVYFSVAAKSDYGKLSHKVIDDLIAGSRVEVSSQKKDPLDFVLWKPAKPGEPAWDSPWGMGRPGWHSECSAMAMHELGETIDIHGGGEDLKFPHHENEIAQSECASGKPFANYWIHNGFVTIKDEKMSKSSGNFWTIRDILNDYSGEVLRYFLMKVHYRSPLNVSKDGLDEAKAAMQRFYNTFEKVPPGSVFVSDEDQSKFEVIKTAFVDALCDDLNISVAIAQLVELSKLVNTVQAGSEVLLECGQLLGLFENWNAGSGEEAIPVVVQELFEKRQQARAAKDFDLADQLRGQIQSEGYVIEDSRDGARLKKV